MLNVLNMSMLVGNCFYGFWVFFSPEREEVESASLSAKEKSGLTDSSRAIRGGGVAADLETPTPSPTTTSSSSSASVRCLRQRASWSQHNWSQSLCAKAGLQHSDFGLMHLALNFFFITMYKLRTGKKAKKCFLQINVQSEILTH